MHPASRIAIYVLTALVIPGLSFFWLALLLSAALPVFIMQRRHPLRLIWRTRWLLAVLVLGYGYSLPGEAALPGLLSWSPSWAGVIRGAEQAARLLVLLLWLDLLVLHMPSSALLAGLHALMRPLAPLGIDVARVALRLGLTLRAIEGLERGRGNLRRLLRDEDAALGLPERVRLDAHALGPMDVLVPGALLAGALGLWLSN